MAATCLDVITYAMRQSRVIGPGKAPKASEAEEGMVALQALYDEWRTTGMFGKLKDCRLTADTTAKEGHRYYVPAGITLTDATIDYVDECGVTRQPYDLTLYEVLDSSNNHSAKLFDRTKWVDLLDLDQSDEAPLAHRNAYGLAACLATSGGFISMFGRDPTEYSIALSAHFLHNLTSKRGSTQATRTDEYM